MLTGSFSFDSASRRMPSHQVGDVAEAARLLAVAEDRDVLVAQRLAHERRHRAAVVQAHARAVGVEDADDLRVDPVVAVVGHRHRFGEALGLVVDAARADRVDVAPVGFLLRVLERIAVDLGGRGDDEPRVLRLGQAERLVRAERADLQRRDRQLEVVDRAGRAGPVQHAVDRAVDVDVVRDVVLDEHEVAARQVGDVVESPVSRLSMPTTRRPRSSRVSDRCEPMKPAAPVMTILGIGSSASCELRTRCSGAARARA